MRGEVHLTDRQLALRYFWLLWAVAMMTTVCFTHLLREGLSGGVSLAVSLGIALAIRAMASLGTLGRSAISRMADAIAGRTPSPSFAIIAAANIGAVAILALIAGLDTNFDSLSTRLFMFIPIAAWTIWDIVAGYISVARENS